MRTEFVLVQSCCMLTGILEDNGKEIPSNYEATDF